MRVLFLLLLSVIVFPAALHASDSAEEPIANLQFQSLHFGQAPVADMICVGGPCYEGLPGEDIEKKRKPPFSAYKLPMDITHLGRAEISAPKYDFFRNRLFQISFEIECDPEESEFWVESVENTLYDRYGLTLVKTSAREPALQSGATRTYLTTAGALVEIYPSQWNGGWHRPHVKIYDQTLMDELRLYVNPSYISNPFR